MRRSIRELCEQDHHGDPRTLDRWLANKTPESVRGWIESPEHYCVVVESEGKAIAGFGMISRAGEILLLYVSPEAIGAGAGYRMLVDLESRAEQWGLETIALDSTRTARAFYERNGYEGVGAGSDRADGLSCDAMRKRLGPEEDEPRIDQ